MEISLNWLRKYADLPADPAALAAVLTSLGLEVEGIRRLGGATGVVVGEVLECERHPEADKLSLCRVTDGREIFPVVCGAPNVAKGQKVLLARLGAELPGGVKIKPTKIRGQESLGMLCAEDEVGLGEGHEGILVLGPFLAPGTPMEDVPGLCDAIFTVNVTPNRPDALSHLGVARELAARFGKPLSYPESLLREQGPEVAGLASLRLKNFLGCTLYTGRVIQGVKVGASPEWLVKALASVGKKSINNVVDLGNYVLLELGQPTHAFDLDKLAGASVTVRSANAGEKLKTLDGVERHLTPEDLVIADANGPVVLAGVMGGEGSGVDASTVNVFLEAAYFNPALVRRQARRHGLSTDSSYRFERGVDPLITAWVSDYLAGLIAFWCGGKVAKGRLLQFSPEHPSAPRVVYLRPSRAEKLLGLPVTAESATGLLEAIGLRLQGEASLHGQAALAFAIPGFRGDLEREVDLVEEVARLGDYNRIPVVLPSFPLGMVPLPPLEVLARHLREYLRDAGLNEALSLRFTSRKVLAKLDLPEGHPRGDFVPLRNPLSEDWEILPTTGLTGLLQAAEHNRNNQERDVRFFEIAKVFRHHPEERTSRLPGVEEEEMVCLVLTGEWHDNSWSGEPAPAGYYHLKGLVENLLARIGALVGFSYPSQEGYLHPAESGDILAPDGETRIGSFGTLHPRVAARFGIKAPVMTAEISLPGLLAAAAGRDRTFAPFGQFSAVTRDLNLVVDEAVRHDQVLGKLALDRISHLQEARLNSVYRGPGVPEGKKALHYSFVYRHGEKTLTDEEVNRQQEKLAGVLAKDPAIQIK